VLPEILDERGFVAPTVHFFQQERPEELWHLVSSRTAALVVRIELHMGQWILTDKPLNRVVGVVLKPDSRDGPEILSERRQ
jgi:hypothetical protein